MKGHKVILSSNSVEWSTPQWLYDRLYKEFRFTLDPCSTTGNAKCKRYFTENGLERRWTGRVFMNPPYGPEIGKWVEKAYESSCEGAAVVVCLLPARTDTRWWELWCTRGEIRFIRGRLKFGNSKNPATFPSVVVVFRGLTGFNYPVMREGRY